MLTKKEILQILHNELPVLKERFYVKEIGLFGSIAKGEEEETSDIDILVTLKDENNDLFNFLDLKYYLESVIHKKVDLVMKDAIKPRIKDRILKETIYA
jgi:hypothetical protein